MSKLKEIFTWWNNFDSKDIVIKSESKEFNVKITKESLSHLLGLHYLRLNKKSREIYDMVLNDELTTDDVHSTIVDEKVKLNVTQRIDTFKDFMENLDKAYIVEKTHNNTKLKSQYLAIDEIDGYSRHLGLFATGGIDSIIEYGVDKINDTVLETYIVQDNDNYYQQTTLKEPVEEILFYDEYVGEYRAGSFNLEKDRQEELLIALKNEIIKYCNREYEEEYKLEDFNKHFPDLTKVDIAYTTTEDEKHNIQFSMNLKDLIYTSYVDDVAISEYNLLEKYEGDRKRALETMCLDLRYGQFEVFAETDKDALKEKLGLALYQGR